MQDPGDHSSRWRAFAAGLGDTVATLLSGAGHLRAALAFLTRLPMGAPPPGDLAASMGAFPLAGAVVGVAGAIVYALARWAVPAYLAALLALAATILVTGALHEDGLADTADGLGGAGDRERRLAIMRDSRIGTFGVLALLLTLGLRGGALAAIDRPALAAGALIAAHALSRAAIPWAMRMADPARPDGLGAAAGKPSPSAAGIAATLAILVAALALPPGAAIAALAGSILGAVLVIFPTRRGLGGYTGDVLGAVQQLSEALALLAVAAVL